MKKLFIAVMALVISLFISAGAGAVIIYDDPSGDNPDGTKTYYGGLTNIGLLNQDVLGVRASFVDLYNIQTLTATQSGGTTTVVLYGGYFGVGGAGTPTSFGDLYISTTGWVVSTPSADGHDALDQFTNTEQWNYIVSYQNQKLYPLNNFDFISGTSNSSLIDPNTWTIGAAGRTAQAWTGGYFFGSQLQGVVTRAWDQDAETLTFTFPDLGPVDQLGFHWTMACGNDVIEGQGHTVPEPGTLLLLGFGLAGLGLYRRRAS